jgi:hypothetical protein
VRKEDEAGSEAVLKREKTKIGDKAGQDQWGRKLRDYLRVGARKTERWALVNLNWPRLKRSAGPALDMGHYRTVYTILSMHFGVPVRRFWCRYSNACGKAREGEAERSFGSLPT